MQESRDYEPDDMPLVADLLMILVAVIVYLGAAPFLVYLIITGFQELFN